MITLIIFLISGYFMLSPVNVLTVMSLKYTIIPFLSALIIFLWLLYYFESKKIYFKIMDLFLFLFLFTLIFSIWWNSPGSSINEWITIGSNTLLALMFLVIRTVVTDRNKFIIMLRCLLIGFFILATLYILNEFHVIHINVHELDQKTYSGGEVSRSASVAGGVNRSSFYFCIAIILASGLLFETKSFLGKLFLWAVILLSFVANLFTYSVGGLYILLVGILILFYPLLKRRFTVRRIAMICALLTFFLISAFHNPRIYGKYEQIRDSSFMHWGSTRGATNWAAIKAISNHNILGVGPTEFTKEIADYYPFYNKKDIKGAHNTYLSIIGEAGYIGFIFFIIFMYYVIITALHHHKEYWSYLSKTILVCMTVALIFCGVFDAQRDKLFWIILSVTAATSNLQKKEFKLRQRYI